MGHGAYEENAADQRPARICPFDDVRQVWDFDPAREYGLPTMAQTIRYYQQWFDRTQEQFPDQLVTGGYYKSVVSGRDPDIRMEHAAGGGGGPERFAQVLRRFGRYTLHYARAWAQTSIDAYIQHDDIVWSQGPFMRPAFYRGVIFPIYRELLGRSEVRGQTGPLLLRRHLHPVHARHRPRRRRWVHLRARQRLGPGGEGIRADPRDRREQGGLPHDGIRHVGTGPDQIDATLRIARDCRGFMVAVGNHIPPSVPTEMVLRYLDHLKANWWR